MTPKELEKEDDVFVINYLAACALQKKQDEYGMAFKELLRRLQNRHMIVDSAILRHAIAAYAWTVQEGALTWSGLADGIKRCCSLENPSNKEIWIACMKQAGREDEL